MKIEYTGEVSLKYGVKVLVYGKAGAGKTRLIASAPSPIILSSERGLLSLRAHNLPYVEISTLAELREARVALAGTVGQKYHTIALDSVSDIAEVILANELRANKSGQMAYGKMAEAVLDEFRQFRNMYYKHVVFIAKQEFVRDGITGGMIYRPMFPGNVVGANAPYMFDEVWQLSRNVDPATQRPFWMLRTQPDHQTEAKDRSGVLNEWENADPATGGGLTSMFQRMLANAS